MAQRSKMEKATAESETLSFPATYQCIVCQIPTISLSRLHRHQTYQHTSEELSLSTIALQCSLINNVNATNSIIYDNSWLCDPLKQAEFYTVSANLLNDCNNNPTNCNPVDYVIEKDVCNFNEENNIEIADEQEMQDFDFRIDHNYGRMANFTVKSPENEMRIQKFRSIGTETNCDEFLEKVNQPVASSTLCTETERIITYLEEVMQVEEISSIGAESNYNSQSPGNIIDAEKGKVVDAKRNDGVESPKNVIQPEESKDIHGEIAAKKRKVVELKSSGNYSISKSAAKETETGEFKVPHANSILKSAEKSKKVEFKVPDANSILKSAAKKTEVGQFKVPKAHSILKFAEKETEVKELKVCGRKANCTLKSAENFDTALKVEVPKIVDAKANSVSNYADKSVGVEKLKVVDSEPIKSAKKEINVVKPEADTFVNCIQSLCIDLEKIQNKPQKRKRSASRNIAPRITKAATKPRASKKKAKTSDSIPENKVEQEVNQNTEVSVNNVLAIMNCTDPILKSQKTKNSVGPPRKKAKISHSVPANITIRQEVDQETQIPIKNHCSSPNCAEFNLNTHETENFVEPPTKKVKISNSVIENTAIMRYTDEESEIPTQNDFRSIKQTELSLESPKTNDSVELPSKKVKTSNSDLENSKIIQESEISSQNDFASINNTQLNWRNQGTGNSVKKIFSEEDIVEAQLKALFQQQTETRETEIPVIDDSTNSHWIDYHVVKMETPIPDKENLAHENFIQQYVDTCKAEIPAEIPVEVKSEPQEFPGDEVNDLGNSENSDDSVIATLPSSYTFPWYPPDMNDYSILVLDPEADQLVWTEVAIVDDKNKVQSENLQETVVLPELTEADLRNNEICETMTISSRFQTKETSGNLLRCQTRGKATKTKKKPRTNFVLRPRKAAVKKML